MGMFDNGFSGLQVVSEQQNTIPSIHVFTDASCKFVDIGNDVQVPVVIAGYVSAVKTNEKIDFMDMKIRRVNSTIQTAEAAAIDMGLDHLNSIEGVCDKYIHTDSNASFDAIKSNLAYQCGERKHIPKVMKKDTDFSRVVGRVTSKVMNNNNIHIDCIKSHVSKEIQFKSYQSLDSTKPNSTTIETINRGNAFIDKVVGTFSSERLDSIEEYKI